MSKITLMPYTTKDGMPTFRDSELIAFYHQMLTDGWLVDYIHDQSIRSSEDFLQHIKSGACMFWAAYVDGDPAAVFWVNRFEGRNVRGHFAFFKKYWGTEIPLQIGKEIIQLWVENEYEGSTLFDVVIGVMPKTNRHAIQYIDRLGGQYLGTVPNYFRDRNDKLVDGVFIYFTKGSLKQ